MDPTQFKQLLDRLDSLSDKLGKGVDYFWPLAVKQVYVGFYVSLIAIIVGGILTASSGILAYYLNRHDDTTLLSILAVVATIILSVLFVSLIVVMLCGDLPAFLNPEYAALKSLLRSVK